MGEFHARPSFHPGTCARRGWYFFDRAAWGHGYNAGDVSITHPHQYATPSLQVASTGAAYRATLAGRGGKVVVQVPHKAAVEHSH